MCFWKGRILSEKNLCRNNISTSLGVDSIWYSPWSFPWSKSFHLHFIFPLRCQTARENDGVPCRSLENFGTMFLFNCNIKLTNQFIFLLWLSKLYVLQNFKAKQRNLLQWSSVISYMGIQIRLRALHKYTYLWHINELSN